MELAGLDPNSEACGLIWWSPLNLTLSLVLHGCLKQVRWLLNRPLRPFCRLLQALTAFMKGATHVPQCTLSILLNFVLNANNRLEFVYLQLELLVIAGYHTAVNRTLETVQTARQVGKVWLCIILIRSLFFLWVLPLFKLPLFVCIDPSIWIKS